MMSLGSGIGFVSVFWGAPYAEHQVLDTILCNVYAWITTLAVLSVMKAAAFAGALILYEIIRRIPVLRWCICGIGGEK